MEALDLMFVGHVTKFAKNADDPVFESDVVVELTNEEGQVVELRFEAGNRCTYFSFRKADFLRAVDSEEDDCSEGGLEEE